MPVPWFLLSLALGRSPMVLPLERLVGPQDATHSSPGLSCHLWDDDILCLPGDIMPALGPVLVVPTHLQTELVLRCRKETDCDLFVRVAVHLAVHGEQGTGKSLKMRKSLEKQLTQGLRSLGMGSIVYDCFEAALGSEVQTWSYTQPRYEKKLNLTQQLPALPWLNVSADGDNARLVLNVSEEQHFSLFLYWKQVQGPPKPL
nr:interleukin-17 receptor C-like isoform X2 [Aotus nancymaae]